MDFDAPDLATRIEALSLQDIDRLPFGVIRLDRNGIVLIYSATEAKQSGYRGEAKGHNFYELSSCAGMDDFRGRIARAAEEGPVDLEFGWPRDYGNRSRELRIRVQSARDGGIWLFIERDSGQERPPS